MHAGNAAWMVFCGDASVRGIILLSVITVGVLNSQFVSCKDMDQVLASGITSWDSIRSKHLHMLIAGACANPCVDVFFDCL